MAEAIARKIIMDRGCGENIGVSSAGLCAYPGDRASYQAAEVMKEWGIDLSRHCAKQISLELIDNADIILTMTEGHKREIIEFDPESRGRVFTLREYAEGTGGSINDPYGMPVTVYRKCAEELKGYIEKVIDRLQG
jgi:protein-tyrosine-phosphatase